MYRFVVWCESKNVPFDLGKASHVGLVNGMNLIAPLTLLNFWLATFPLVTHPAFTASDQGGRSTASNIS